MIERLSKIRSEAQIRHHTLAEVFHEKVFPITLYLYKARSDIPETEPLALGPLLSDSPGKCPGESFGPKSLKTLFSKFKIQNWEANSTQR